MDKALRKMLQNPVIVQHQVGVKNAAGECEYEDPITYKGKVEYKETVFKDSTGKEITSKTRTFLDGAAVVALDDLITLPSGDTRLVISILIKYNEKGIIDHLVVYS